ncbi:oligosaccharide flippase family protein [Serratia fonticola]
MSKNKLIFKNTIFLATRTIFSIIISFYTTRVILNQLGASDYGLFSVIYGVVGFTVFLSSAMNESVQRFISINLGKGDLSALRDTVKNSIATYVVMAIIFFTVLFFSKDYVVEHFLRIPETSLVVAKMLYVVAIISISISILQTPFNALVIAHEKMSFYAYMSIFDVLSKLIIASLIAIVTKDKLFTYSLLLLLSTLLVFIIYIMYCFRWFKSTLRGGRFSFFTVKELSTFSFWNIFGNFAYICRTQGINIIINLFFATTVNAAYALSTSVSNAITSLTQSLAMSIRPQIFKTYAENNISRYELLIMVGSKYTFSLLFLLAAPLILCTEQVLSLWLVSTPEYTVIFVRFVLIAALIDSFSLSIITGIQATGRIKVYQIVVSFFVFISLPISYFLFSTGYPAYSAFIPLIVMSLLNLNLRVFFLCSSSSFNAKNYYKRVLIPCGFFVLVSMVINVLIKSNVIYDGAIKTISLLFIHSLISFIIFLLIVPSSEERSYIFNFVLRKFK